MAKLTEKTGKVLAFVQKNDNGEGITIADVADGVGLTVKQVGPIVWTSLGKAAKDGSRGPLVEYKKLDIEGEEKPVGYVFITDEGRNFVNED